MLFDLKQIGLLSILANGLFVSGVSANLEAHVEINLPEHTLFINETDQKELIRGPGKVSFDLFKEPLQRQNFTWKGLDKDNVDEPLWQTQVIADAGYPYKGIAKFEFQDSKPWVKLVSTEDTQARLECLKDKFECLKGKCEGDHPEFSLCGFYVTVESSIQIPSKANKLGVAYTV
ncbi:uncharacterized protein L201_005441 [Kwoniella dendrophila CBS 6074]|uniref:Uncharacterized protein n=1 Tax=Kwoniella dendrophila CBS 6074 TaxID=1295534 RepID=A0AAX4JYN7_9TREE